MSITFPIIVQCECCGEQEATKAFIDAETGMVRPRIPRGWLKFGTKVYCERSDCHKEAEAARRKVAKGAEKMNGASPNPSVAP